MTYYIQNSNGYHPNWENNWHACFVGITKSISPRIAPFPHLLQKKDLQHNNKYVVSTFLLLYYHEIYLFTTTNFKQLKKERKKIFLFKRKIKRFSKLSIFME